MSKNYLDNNGLIYVWAKIKAYISGLYTGVSDVKIGNSSLVSSGIATIPNATASSPGVVEVPTANGLSLNSGSLSMASADSSNKGTMKLYTSTGSSTDGTMDRNSITTALGTKVSSSSVGAASGVCPLNASSKIDTTYLPSYVDDVIEAYPVGSTELASDWLAITDGGTPFAPETGKIYVLMAASTHYDANSQFRWGGTAYVKLADGGVTAITNAQIDDIFAS